MCYVPHLVKVCTVILMIIFITTVKCQGEQQSWKNYQASPFLYKLLNGIQNENTLDEYNPQELKDDGTIGQENLNVFSRNAPPNKQDKSIKSAAAPGDAKSSKTSSPAQASSSGAASPASQAPSPNAGSPPPSAGSATPSASSPAPPSSASQSPPKPAASKSSEPSGQAQGNDDPKVRELAKLVEQLYVAQAQVQLEASEIQKAQSVAATAQQALEEAANNVRIITEALHTAQQDVATAAIRAQTAQLQLAAHDQLLFAARQRVDALSSQMVGLQAEAGIRPCKVVVDMQDLSNKLKQPLADYQKPTPIPSILSNSGADSNSKSSIREDTKDKKFGWNCAKARESSLLSGEETPNNRLEKSENDQSLRYILSHGQDLIKYNDLILQDKGAPTVKENNQGKRSSDDKNPNYENEGLSERDLRDLYNFIEAADPMQNLSRFDENVNQNQNDNEQSQASQLQDFGILRPALQKSSDRKYIDDFLNKIRNSEKREDKDFDKRHEKPQEKKLVHRDPNINEYIVNFETKRLGRENSRASQRKKNFAERLANRKDNLNFNNKDF